MVRDMTEIELNERIKQLEIEKSESFPNQERESRRCYRRAITRKKDYSLRQIITWGGYAPHRGYISGHFVGDEYVQDEYIKYPKNSNCQRWMKRETSKRQRRCSVVPHKGNYYRRLFDYWWTFY